MKILIVDDEMGIRKGLKHLLSREGYEVYDTGEYEEALSIAENKGIEIALLDIRLGTRDGMELLKDLIDIDREMICLMITGYGSVSTAVDAMKAGAADYILKPIDNDKLLQAVESQLKLKSLIDSNNYLKSELMDKVYNYRFLTANEDLKKMLGTADRIKDTDETVMITGESGTGKEVLSRYFHFTSRRKNGPFVGVNCAALPESLLLSELFGHEKGAFTGAHERKKGKFELADGGTLFLDEIGDMSLETQAKLLRVLEERRFHRVGGNSDISVDIRVITATNKDLENLIRGNRFRQDLFYRLKVFSFHIPPLRARPEDILLLANHFIAHYNKKYTKEVAPLSKEDERFLKDRRWPGNVRELQNVINQGVLLGEEGVLKIERDSMVTREIPGDRDSVLSGITETGGKSLQEQLQPVIARYEKELLRKSLLTHKYNRTAAADELGITRKTLSRKMENYGL